MANVAHGIVIIRKADVSIKPRAKARGDGKLGAKPANAGDRYLNRSAAVSDSFVISPIHTPCSRTGLYAVAIFDG